MTSDGLPPQPRVQSFQERINGIDQSLVRIQAFDTEIQDGVGRAPYSLENAETPLEVRAVGERIIERRRRIAEVTEILTTRRAELEAVAAQMVEHEIAFEPVDTAYSEGFVTPALYRKLRAAHDEQARSALSSTPYSIKHREWPRVTPPPTAVEAVAEHEQDTPGESEPSLYEAFVQSYDPERSVLVFTDGSRTRGNQAALAHELLRRGGDASLMSNDEMAQLLGYRDDMPTRLRAANLSAAKTATAKVLERLGLTIEAASLPREGRSGKSGPRVGFYATRIPQEALDETGSGEK